MIIWYIIISNNILWYVDSMSVCIDWEKSEHNLSLSNFNNDKDFFQDIPELEKILGHYDITAVLKYILANLDCQIFHRPFVKWRTYNELIIAPKQDWIYKWVSKYNFEIPNKPLHLYTQQEEKDLLELLNKLW